MATGKDKRNVEFVESEIRFRCPNDRYPRRSKTFPVLNRKPVFVLQSYFVALFTCQVCGELHKIKVDYETRDK